MQKVLRIMSSRKLGISLLVLTIILSIVGTTLFDQNQLGNYARSWWFVLVIVFLLLSTATCTVQRIRGQFLKKDPLDTDQRNFNCEIITKKDIFKGYSTLNAELQKKRYNTCFKKIGQETFLVSGVKGELGFWGSIIFHISFLIIGFGVIFSLAFKFSGDFILVEGETFSDYQAGYMNVKAGVLYRNNHGQYQLKFKNFEPQVSNSKFIQSEQFSEDYISSIEIIDNYQIIKKADLGVNQKVKYKGFTINPDYYGHGYAPKIKITKSSEQIKEEIRKEEILLDSYLVLNTDLHGSYDEVAEVLSKVTYRDEVELDELNWKININFFPNKPQDGERVVESSPFAEDPMFSLKILDLKKQKLIYQGTVDLKEPVRIGSYVLEFSEVKNWQRFLVRKDRGQDIVYIGFFLGIVGLVLRFTQHRREIRSLFKHEEGKTVVCFTEVLENKTFQKSDLDQFVTLFRGD